MDSKSPTPCRLFAAGFNFGLTAVWETSPYDGRLHHLFFGEELIMVLRLYTHGVDLFAPPATVCYHLWSRSYRPTSTPEWDQQQVLNGDITLRVQG